MTNSESYRILGIPYGAPKDEIEKAYKKLAMQWHPDRNKSPDAESKMKEINQAFQQLTSDKPEFITLGDLFGRGFNFSWRTSSFSTSLTLDLNNSADAQKIIDLLNRSGFIIKGYRIETRG